VPPHLVRFLDYAADHVLLQRVGGGYRFVHILLRDYFADLSQQELGSEGKA
jgi:eukaryotic-like serine/threonine-protein kinase